MAYRAEGDRDLYTAYGAQLLREEDANELAKQQERTMHQEEHACECHERMGNDFWFLPRDKCLSDKPCNRSCDVVFSTGGTAKLVEVGSIDPGPVGFTFDEGGMYGQLPASDQFVTYLKPADYKAFMDALDNPKPPTEALKRLMRGHRQTQPSPPTGQTRTKSLIETITSTAIGFAVSMILVSVVMPAFGYPTTWAHDFWITCIFTVASIARGYGVRRLFESLR